jgi:glycosyltransferase involved in cell wall biosynthesis
VLEGFSAGVPVLTSSAAALPEVAGDAALLVDPNDTDAIGEGLVRLFGDPDLRRRLVAAGSERLATFSWERAAGATAQVLRAAAGRSAGAR